MKKEVVFIIVLVVICSFLIFQETGQRTSTGNFFWFSQQKPVFLSTPVSECGTISSPGVYELQGNIMDHDGTCITINSSDVIFDGKGFIIDGDYTTDSRGISAHKIGSGSITNVTIKNVVITNWPYGIDFEKVSNSSITNSNLSFNARGVYIGDDTYSVGTNNDWDNITNNIISYNNWGIVVSLRSPSYDHNVYLTIKNNTVIFNVEGMYLTEGNYISIIDNNVSLNNNKTEDSANNGITLGLGSSTVVNNTLNSNLGNGLYITSTYNIITNNLITLNNESGIFLRGSTNDVIAENTIYSNSNGITLDVLRIAGLNPSSNNEISNNNIYSNKVYGIYVENGTSNTFTNNNLYNNLNEDILAAPGINPFNYNNNIFTNQNIGTNPVIISFSYDGTVGIKEIDFPSYYPPGYFDIGKYIQATASSNSWLYLTFYYTDDDVGNVNESSLRVWKYNGSWYNTSFYSINNVNTAGNYVYANITSFSTFAPMGQAGGDFLVRFVSSTPSNNSGQNKNWVFVNVTSTKVMNTAILEWNGTNITMNPNPNSGKNWYYNQTGLIEGQTYIYKVYGQNATNWSVSETRTVTIDSQPPRFSQNSTLMDMPSEGQVTHLLKITDNFKLSGYIFSFDNCTDNFVNDTWKYTPVNDTYWVVKTLNTTPDCTFRWQFHANDSANNWNSSLIYSYSTGGGSSDTQAPTFSNPSYNTTQAGKPCNFSITWNDNQALQPNGQYIFSFNNCSGTFVNDTAVYFTGSTQQTVSVVKTLNSSICTIKYKWYAKDNASNWNSTSEYNFTTTSGQDTTPPTYSNIVASPNSPIYSPSQTYTFSSTWIDNVLVDNVILEFSGTNYSYKQGQLTKNGNVYSKTFSGLGAATYNYRWYANDTSNNWNATSTYTYIINKATSSLNLVANYWTVQYPTQTNVSGTGCPSQISCTLYRDGVSKSNPDIQNLTVAIYLYVYNTSGNQNYTSYTTNHNLNVTNTPVDNPPTVNLKEPENGLQTNNTSVLFKCNATDDQKIQNLTLYHNASGWNAIPSSTNSSCGKTCSINYQTNLPANKTYLWSCLAYDNATITQSDWADQNWTFTIYNEGILKCSDNTSYGECSSNKPKYCNQGTLIDNCTKCNCTSGICKNDGSCESKPGPGPGGGCTNGDKKCSNNILQLCSSGSWKDNQTCDYGCNDMNITNIRCNTQIESPNCQGKRCLANLLQECQGNVWHVLENCTICNETLLKCVSCLENEKKCQDNKLLNCQNGEWTSQECEQGCEIDKCIQVEKPKTNFLIYIIAGIVILVIILIIILTRKKTISPVYEPLEPDIKFQTKEQSQSQKQETDLTKLVRDAKKLDETKINKPKSRKIKKR
jgi:parallel beta-helix repeat protein